MTDQIVLDPGEVRKIRFFHPPEVPASDPQYVKHVSCEGARFHVLSWHLVNSNGETHCSEERCIVNKNKRW